MRVRIDTELAAIASELKTTLEEAGHQATVQLARTRTYELAYDRDLPLDDVTTFLSELAPLSPAILPATDLGDVDVVIRLGADKALGHWDLTVHADDSEFANEITERSKNLGFDISDTEVEQCEDDRIRFGGAPPLAREVLRWQLAKLGVHKVIEEKSWSDGDDDIWLYVRHPELAGKPLRERCAVVLQADDLGAAMPLQELILAAGFPRVQLKKLEPEARPTFKLTPGPLGQDAALSRELQAVIDRFFAGLDLDDTSFPLEIDTDADPGSATLDLPLGQLREGTLRPWAGHSLERWDVELLTDSASMAARLLEPLRDAGIERVRVQSAPGALIDAVVRFPPAASLAAIEICDVLGDAETGHATIRMDDSRPKSEHKIIIELPLASVEDRETTLKRIAANWDLSLKTPDPSDYETLQHDLRALPWKSFEAETDSVSRGRIQYGGAPLAIVEYLRHVISEATGHTLEMEKAWSDADDDIWIHLPSGDSAVTEDVQAEELDLDAWIRGDDHAAPTRPLLELDAAWLRAGPVRLARRQGLRDDERALVPDPAQFAHYCLDATTAASLIHVAESVQLSEPCLLEGETSVSKTSVVLYLASLLQQPVVRLNLNGQTDTGELVGRFVPRDDAGADDERKHPWRWQDGLVVTAMKRGWWVVLDELNLAEPQILERLNPALERVPSLVLTEHRGEVIGHGGEPVSPHFRLFATMNPAEYAGRSALSPAYRDRWRGYRYVQAPGEPQYLAMLRLLIHGEQPEVAVLGERFVAAQVDAPLGQLAEVPGIDAFLRALARFHAGVEGAARSRTGSLGARRKERYVFTRRGLLALMDYLALHVTPGEGEAHAGPEGTLRRALLRYYLARVRPGSDRTTVARLLDAAGIGPATWAPEAVDAGADAAEDDAEDRAEDDTEDDAEGGPTGAIPWAMRLATEDLR